MELLKTINDFLKRTLFKNCYVENCRCCGKKLHRPGGIAVQFIGPGFCAECAKEIMSK